MAKIYELNVMRAKRMSKKPDALLQARIDQLESHLARAHKREDRLMEMVHGYEETVRIYERLKSWRATATKAATQ